MVSFKIHLTDPSKSNDKYGSYVSYKITSQVTKGGVVGPPITTLRRYSDFSWLTSELSSAFPGVIIPPLPEKQAVGRFNNDFIESRRRALERFLRRVATHPELSESEIFLTFLQADDATFLREKEVTANRKPRFTSTALSWFEGTVQSLANGKPEIEKSAADTKIDEISNYITQLEKQMASTLKHADGLVKRNREIAQALLELGQSLSILGQSEGDNLGKGMMEMGSSLDSLSSVTSQHAEAETVKFLESIDEYARMVGSIKSAIQQRQLRKDSYFQAMVDLETKQSAHRKLVGVPGKESQLRSKEQAVQTAQESFDAAKVEFEKVTERLLVEFEIFKSQRALDMKEIMVDFITLQLEYNKKSEEEWRNLLPKLQLLSLDGNDVVEPANPSIPPPVPPPQNHENLEDF